MGEGLVVWGVSTVQIQTYYIFVFISFILLLYRYRSKTFALFIILIFYWGLFSYFGTSLFNYYKIGITLLTLFWLVKTKSIQSNPDTNSVILSFLLFTFTFLLTAYINDDYFSIIFSQYSRYFILVAFFLIFFKFRENGQFKNYFDNVIFDLLLVQILLSIVKFLIMRTTESLVGSISSQGGAVAASLPILGFIFIWLMRGGKLERKDWLFTFGLMLIGFVSVKRAVWFILPIIIALLIYYVPRRRLSPKIAILSIIIVPLIFYLGVRLNSTLNREGKIWGSFDLEYVLEYAETYSFGNTGFTGSGYGRGGATLLLYENFVNGRYSLNEVYGYGLRYMFTTDYEQFQQLGFGLHNKGSAAGVFQTMVSNGYMGILFFLIFAVSVLWKTKNKRFRLVLILLFVWEYFFYTGIFFREPTLAILLVYLVVFSEANLSRDKKYLTSNSLV